jgi:O-6-methylguanine DNA methyltransferase
MNSARPTKNLYKLSKALPIHIKIDVREGFIQHVHLSYFEGHLLSCEISPCDSQIQEAIADWLECYIKKARHFPLLPLQERPEELFASRVLNRIYEIPLGKTLSYAELAAQAGNPKAARAAGSACGSNPTPLFIPCHRVITSSGKLGGFTGDLRIKKLLLDFES